jgi:hypothetical protein
VWPTEKREGAVPRATAPDPRAAEDRRHGPPAHAFSFGLGEGRIVAAEPGDEAAWDFSPGLPFWLGILEPDPPRDAWLDREAAEALAPERPFEAASSRGRTAAVVGALLATVAVALLARRGLRVACAALAGIAVAWSVAAWAAWGEPGAAARVVRVRAFTADGRAEIVTDTAVLVPFREGASLSFETGTGPCLPVARDRGEALATGLTLVEKDGRWRASDLDARPGRPVLVRAQAALALGPESRETRERVLAKGQRLRTRGGVPEQAGGQPLSTEELRYLLRHLAPPADEVAWSWSDGAPAGCRATGADGAPGSGTLVLAAVPRAGRRESP